MKNPIEGFSRAMGLRSIPEQNKKPREGVFLSGRWDSNPRPSPWQGDILPTEPRPHACISSSKILLESG